MTRTGTEQSYRYFDIVMAAFVTVLIVSNIASSAKIVDWGFSLFGIRLAFDGGTILFPTTEGILPTTLNFQAHSAPLQAVFYDAAQFPDAFRGALFIAFHGSWNRQPPTGYKVVAVIFKNGNPVKVEDFLTGWLASGNRVRGRPVGVAVAADGSLYVSDDTGYLFRVRYGG
jgi:hypothetical protein